MYDDARFCISQLLSSYVFKNYENKKNNKLVEI